jgi:hypothetical protein
VDHVLELFYFVKGPGLGEYFVAGWYSTAFGPRLGNIADKAERETFFGSTDPLAVPSDDLPSSTSHLAVPSDDLLSSTGPTAVASNDLVSSTDPLAVRAGCRIFARHVAHVGLVQTDWVTG